ncbi:unnamed protein product [Paramecium sonneborni]|uniref:Peptidase S59 domain-containing protein n=1 Tax=Paramecium sonneborni TaxID=65129 RepID=A0A8S1RHU8_9CILI|nr:unnamed protein product [Paramecium sonneborni]
MSNTLFQRNANSNIFQGSQPNSNSWNIPQTTRKRDVQGSYRAKFEQIKIQVVDDKNVLSTSIIFQPQYEKMTMMMIRLEDYYLIRAQQIDDFHISTIQNAIQCKRFNPNLISKVVGQSINIPLFPIQKTANSIWESNNQSQHQQNIFNTNTTSLTDNRQQNNFFSSMNNQNNQQQQSKQQYGNIFNTPSIVNHSNNNHSPNIFSNQRQEQQTTNIFNSNQNVFNNNKPQSEFNNYQSKDQNLPWTQSSQQSGNIFQQNKPQLQIQIPNQQQINDPSQINNNPNNNQTIFSQPQQQLFINNMQQPFLQQQPSQQLQQQQMFQQQQQIQLQQQQQQQQQQSQMMPLQMQIPQQSFQTFQNLNSINMLANDLQMIQYQNQMNPIQFIKQSVDMINNFTTSLNNSIQEMEKLYKLEEEKYLEQEYLINQLEQKKRIERQKKQQEINLLPKKKNDSHTLFRMTPSSNNMTLINSQKSSRISIQQQQSTNYGFNASRISQKSTKIKKEYIIEIYFEESENFITFNEEFNDTKSKVDYKDHVLQKIDQMQVFKNDKAAYFAKSEFIIDENNNQDNHQTLSFRILQTYRPILTKKGYYTLPDINQLTINQLKNVEDFTIYNEFGSLRWDSPTNLLYINLDRIVDIQDSKVEVYDLDQIHEYLKPKINKKLNKSCLITLKVPITINQENYETESKFLQQKCKEQNIELVEIDQIKQQFVVRVDHFSIYTFVHDENEEQQQQIVESQNIISQQLQQQQQSQTQSEIKINKENKTNISQKELEFYELQNQFLQQINDVSSLTKQSTNQKIKKINQKFGLNIELRQDFQICVSNKEMNQIDYELCEQFIKEFKFDNEIPTENQFCIILLKCLYAIRSNNKSKWSPYEKNMLGQRLQFFNILFGNSLIQLQDYLFLIELYSDKLKLEDLVQYQRPNQFQQGLSLILFLEQILQSRISNEQESSYTETIIQEIKNNNLFNQQQKQQQILQFLSIQHSQMINLPLKVDDWISKIFQWKVNQNSVQYSQEWWLGLSNQLEDFEIQSPELAGLYYFLSTKFNRNIEKIYSYLNKNHDPMSLFLEFLIYNQDKANVKIHKRIITNKLTFLIENKERSEFIQLILGQFIELFTASEQQRYLESISRMQNTLFYLNNMEESDDQIDSIKVDSQIHLQKLINQQDYINLGNYILDLNSSKYQNLLKFLFEYTIPILIIFGEVKQLEKIIKKIDDLQNSEQSIYKFSNRDKQILGMSQIFIGSKKYDDEMFFNFEPKNVFEYQMLQVLNEYQLI